MMASHYSPLYIIFSIIVHYEMFCLMKPWALHMLCWSSIKAKYCNFKWRLEEVNPEINSPHPLVNIYERFCLNSFDPYKPSKSQDLDIWDTSYILKAMRMLDERQLYRLVPNDGSAGFWPPALTASEITAAGLSGQEKVGWHYF